MYKMYHLDFVRDKYWDTDTNKETQGTAFTFYRPIFLWGSNDVSVGVLGTVIWKQKNVLEIVSDFFFLQRKREDPVLRFVQ